MSVANIRFGYHKRETSFNEPVLTFLSTHSSPVGPLGLTASVIDLDALGAKVVTDSVRSRVISVAASVVSFPNHVINVRISFPVTVVGATTTASTATAAVTVTATAVTVIATISVIATATTVTIIATSSVTVTATSGAASSVAVAAAAATVAAATVAAATATATVAAATTLRSAGLSNIDGHRSPIDVLAVHVFHGISGIISIVEGHEAKPTGASRHPVSGQIDVLNFAKLPEVVTQVSFTSVKGKVANENFALVSRSIIITATTAATTTATAASRPRSGALAGT